MPESNSKPSKTTIPNLMDVTMEKIRDMVDVETIIGDPITVGTEVTIIPISKVSYGFASGGSDLPAKVPERPVRRRNGGWYLHSARGLLSRTERRCSPAPDDRGKRRYGKQSHSHPAGSHQQS